MRDTDLKLSSLGASFWFGIRAILGASFVGIVCVLLISHEAMLVWGFLCGKDKTTRSVSLVDRVLFKSFISS